MLTTSAYYQHFLDIVERTCTLFGSRSINVHTLTSDYDYYTTAENMDKLIAYLYHNVIQFNYKEVYQNKLQFQRCIELTLDHKIQIMCYENGDPRHSIFLQHIEIVKAASKHLDMQHKPYRCHFFENCYKLLCNEPHELTPLELVTITRIHPEYLI